MSKLNLSDTMAYLWSDEGRHGGPDTTRVYRMVDGRYMTIHRHGGSTINSDVTSARPSGVAPHPYEIEVEIPSSDARPNPLVEVVMRERRPSASTLAQLAKLACPGGEGIGWFESGRDVQVNPIGVVGHGRGKSGLTLPNATRCGLIVQIQFTL